MSIDDEVMALHRSLPEYSPAPLIRLPNMAKELGLGQILVKDESHRFGLKAFKALGATYAIYRFIAENMRQEGENPPDPGKFYSGDVSVPPGKYTFTTATDGNHGRGVAWTASKLGQKSVIYMPRNSARARIENIRSTGAEVVIVDGDYDSAVNQCREDAYRLGRQIISDTSWEGYEKIPRWIQDGYRTIFREINDILHPSEKIDFVFVQGGVGALAAAVVRYFRSNETGFDPQIISVEPEDAACLLESIESPGGTPRKASGKLTSIMAGLNCGTPSPTAWPYIKNGMDFFMTISDVHALTALKAYYHPSGDDPTIISGESGASSLGALMALCRDEIPQKPVDFPCFQNDATVLLINTEGDTDPEFFKKAVAD